MDKRCLLAASTCLFLTTVFMAGTVYASGHEHHDKDHHDDHAKAEHREHGAHVHGAGHLNLVMDGDKVEMEYVASGVDIVGFERPAVLKRDKKAIAKATEVLQNGNMLVSFPNSAGCKMTSSKVDFLVDEDMHGHDHDDDHKHEHGHDAHDHKHEIHTEFQSHYAFTCNKPQNVKYVDVNVFKLFKRTEKIDVQAIGPWGQSAANLTANSSRLIFQ